jgi:hypothetical protein
VYVVFVLFNLGMTNWQFLRRRKEPSTRYVFLFLMFYYVIMSVTVSRAHTSKKVNCATARRAYYVKTVLREYSVGSSQ